MNTPFEIEHKYLIAFPDLEQLRQRSTEIWEIAQTYLLAPQNVTERVRRVLCDGITTYFHTEKRRINALRCEEREQIIDLPAYTRLMQKKIPQSRTVEKTRYRLLWAGRTVEIDVYPFWRDRAIMEIEVEQEDAPVELPPFVRVYKEVTEDRRYKNAALALEIVAEPIFGEK